ncbi:MAG: hypothetical protein JJE09_01430 [Bacteroidia bacterium]|nr:hypothetical protein [Bacteroidia bacterium]
MEFLIRIYRVFNYVSLDVACGAMVCAAFFSQVLHVELRPVGLVSLGVTVWVIYTADRLIDVYKLKRESSSKRHRFHQKNFLGLFIALIMAVAIDIFLILQVPGPVLTWGIGLAGVVILYLFFQQRLFLFKELVVSILYSAGIFLPAMSLSTIIISKQEIILIIFFILTAFINLVLFSWYDLKHDLADNQYSLVTFLGRDRAKVILVILFFLQLFLFIGLMVIYVYWIEAVILLAINLGLLMLLLFPERLSNKDLYRLIGDGVFLFPLPYLLLG